MKLETKYHGAIEINEDEIIHFKQGLPGFLDEKQFSIIPFSEDSVFFILQSINTSGLAFVIANPFTFFKSYKIQLPENIIDQLQVKTKEDVALYSIVTIYEPLDKSTVNLQAPVVVNVKTKQGKQLVLTNTDYKTKHLLFHQQVHQGQEG